MLLFAVLKEFFHQNVQKMHDFEYFTKRGMLLLSPTNLFGAAHFGLGRLFVVVRKNFAGSSEKAVTFCNETL